MAVRQPLDSGATPEVVCVGNVTRDVLLYTATLPNLDGVAYVDERTTCLGGRGAIPALVAGALGARTSLCTTIGDRDFETIVAQLHDAGVGIVGIGRGRPGSEAFEVITAIGRQEQDAISFFVPKATELEVTDAQRQVVAGSRIVYFGTHRRRFNRELMELAGDQTRVHSLCSYLLQDTDYREMVLHHADVLIGNRHEAALLHDWLKIGNEQELFEYAPRLEAVIVTRAADGVELHRPGLTPLRLPALPAAIRTPLGAGDAFAGGVLYGLARNVGVEPACQVGLAVAAESLAARSSHPDLDTLRTRVAARLGRLP